MQKGQATSSRVIAGRPRNLSASADPVVCRMGGPDPCVPCQATSQITRRLSEMMYKKGQRCPQPVEKTKDCETMRPPSGIAWLSAPRSCARAPASGHPRGGKEGSETAAPPRPPLFTPELPSLGLCDLVPSPDPLARTGPRGRVGVGARQPWQRPEAVLLKPWSVHRAVPAAFSRPVLTFSAYLTECEVP